MLQQLRLVTLIQQLYTSVLLNTCSYWEFPLNVINYHKSVINDNFDKRSWTEIVKCKWSQLRQCQILHFFFFQSSWLIKVFNHWCCTMMKINFFEWKDNILYTLKHFFLYICCHQNRGLIQACLFHNTKEFSFIDFPITISISLVNHFL